MPGFWASFRKGEGEDVTGKESGMTGVREKMFQEMEKTALFERARTAALEYAQGIRSRAVYPSDAALSALKRFEETLPEETGDATAVFDMLHECGSPATVAQIGGRYFGLVNGGVLPVALAVRWLSDFWDQNTPLHVSSPVASHLETVVEGWLRELFGLPEKVVAGFVSGSSMAIFGGLAAARFRILQRAGWDVNRKGLSGAPRIRVVAGEEAHGTVVKAVALLGLGTDHIEWVAADRQGRIRPEAIPVLDDRTLLVLQAGNVNSGAFDDFGTICKKAKAAGTWIHVDGAFGLWAAGTKKLAHLTAGMERADSWSVDAHKTLNAPYDSGILLCRDRNALVGALQATGSYIVYGENRDGMLHTPEMSRRARVVELWAALRYLGRQGVDELVCGLHDRAVQMGSELADAGFEVRNDIVFNQVLVACQTDAETDALIGRIQRSGECWVGGATWQGRRVIRISICSWATTQEDVSRSVRAFVAARDFQP